jgi:hypothetical protein
VIESRHFPENIAGVQIGDLYMLPIPLLKDFNLTFLDDEHAVPPVSLSNDDLTVLENFSQPAGLHFSFFHLFLFFSGNSEIIMLPINFNRKKGCSMSDRIAV